MLIIIIDPNLAGVILGASNDDITLIVERATENLIVVA